MAGKRFNNNNNRYYQHDDRGEPSTDRKGFYVANNRRNGRNGPGRFDRRNRDGDVHMAEGGNRSQHMGMYKARRGGVRCANPRHHNARFDDRNAFQKIHIRNVNGADEDEILAELRRQVDKDFTPLVTSIDDNNFKFYLENNHDVANTMVNLSNRVSIRNRKLQISVFDGTPPYTALTESQIETVKLVMSDRYSVEMNLLDLKNFHNDPKLLHSKIFCPLYVNIALKRIIEIVVKNIPTVIDINLSHNRMFKVNPLIELKNTKIERLNLEGNKIRHIGIMKELQDLPILELNLEGNPICGSYKTEEVYISSLRRIFPRLKHLDGIELQKSIGFEVTETSKLPSTQLSFYCNNAIKSDVVSFIAQYYQVLQMEDRRMLAAAYTENAFFSLMTFIPEHTSGSNKHYSNKMFFDHNRNLMKVTNPEKRLKSLIQGRKAIYDLLSQKPDSVYDPTSLVVDVPLATPQIIHVCVRGIFQIHPKQDSLTRSFTRSLIIVPEGSGYCISNEEFCVSFPTSEQKERAYCNPTNEFTCNLVKEQESTTRVADAPVISDPQNPLYGLQPEQVKKVKDFYENTKMRISYCIECLVNNEWNYEKAGEMFVHLKNESKIPAEYFETA